MTDELTVMANEYLDAACAMPLVEVKKITPWSDMFEGFVPSGRTVEVERRYLWAVEPRAASSSVEQLTADAQAAVDAVAAMGVAGRDRIAVGGHSYGAFLTASLLAHTDLFRRHPAAGGARLSRAGIRGPRPVGDDPLASPEPEGGARGEGGGGVGPVRAGPPAAPPRRRRGGRSRR
jgi:dienelactone hydrolase